MGLAIERYSIKRFGSRSYLTIAIVIPLLTGFPTVTTSHMDSNVAHVALCRFECCQRLTSNALRQ